MNRHDLHPIVRNAINEAVRLGVIDAVGAWEMGVEYRNNGTAIMEALTFASYCGRQGHSKGVERHKAMCELNDAYHAEVARAANVRLAT